MTPEEKKVLARAKGVSVATVNRWIRQGGEDAASKRRRASASQAGRMSRASNPDYGRSWYER